jgi:hypothetical protein
MYVTQPNILGYPGFHSAEMRHYRCLLLTLFVGPEILLCNIRNQELESGTKAFAETLWIGTRVSIRVLSRRPTSAWRHRPATEQSAKEGFAVEGPGPMKQGSEPAKGNPVQAASRRWWRRKATES